MSDQEPEEFYFVIFYTGPDPHRRAYDQYADLLEHLKEDKRLASRTSDEYFEHFFHLCFAVPVYPDDDDYDDGDDYHDEVICQLEYILDPENRKGTHCPGAITIAHHPLFDENQLPIAELEPMTWSDATCDWEFTKDDWCYYSCESRKALNYRRARRLRNRDLISWDRDEKGFTCAVLHDCRTGVTMKNEDPKAELSDFDYDPDAAASSIPCQSWP